MTTPAPNPLAPLLAPLMTFETGTLDNLIQPLFAPLQLNAQGPATALDKLLTGQTPEFLRPFNLPSGLPPFPFPFPTPPPAPGNGAATAARQAASRVAAARAASARAASGIRGQDTTSGGRGIPGAATSGRYSTRTGYR